MHDFSIQKMMTCLCRKVEQKVVELLMMLCVIQKQVQQSTNLSGGGGAGDRNIHGWMLQEI